MIDRRVTAVAQKLCDIISSPSWEPTQAAIEILAEADAVDPARQLLKSIAEQLSEPSPSDNEAVMQLIILRTLTEGYRK